jgi:selenocysteine-specific elongation factor
VGGELRVVATAGHVDHGKSALILRLTGMDPDRFEEEKRRGLTIDLGYAWCTLPSGREIGFVDVPGHERFVRNMLAGVGPVRLVLFVVAADEGWKPQSEEHLQILDVLGVDGGVVALTKRDLVDGDALGTATSQIRHRLAGTGLEGAPIVPVSAVSGEGLDDLVAAIDGMLADAGPPETARARLFVDRVFTITGAGTVVTGTLAGECLAVGDEVERYPGGGRARIRSLQTHKKAEDRACPVSRVAANLVGVERAALARGDVIGFPGAWRPTWTFEGMLRPVRGLGHAITSRGAFKLYAGASEADARLRLYGTTKLEPGAEAFIRIALSEPMVLDVDDRFVLRDAGRRETVGGGRVLDVAPPAKVGRDPADRLTARASATRDELPELLVHERGAVPSADAFLLTGSRATGGLVLGDWFVAPTVVEAVGSSVADALASYHREHPLDEGADLPIARKAALDAIRRAGAPPLAELADALLDDLDDRGVTAREGATIRLAEHRAELGERSADLDRLLEAIGGEREATPPTVTELVAGGIGRDVIDAAARSGAVVRIAPDLVVSTGLIARAEAVVREAEKDGITVSSFRETLGTSRKYAVPLLEWFDHRGVTRREGDLRFPRGV